MIVAVHQPIFLPWPGFFHKAAHSDRLVLLDDVQFPTGRSWLCRNRLKNAQGEFWLRVPVLRKGRGLQSVRRVEIDMAQGWRRKHMAGIRQSYGHAPYFDDYVPEIEAVYGTDHTRLSDFTIDLILLLMRAFSLPTPVLRQSELGVAGRGSELLAALCERLGATRLLALAPAEKHIDAEALARRGIEIVRAAFRPPLYPQLWGDFIYNLSALDLLLNCGPKAQEIVTARAPTSGTGP
jgi:hypothetical protein